MSGSGMSWLVSWKNPQVVQARRIWWRSCSVLGLDRSMTGISLLSSSLFGGAVLLVVVSVMFVSMGTSYWFMLVLLTITSGFDTVAI